MAPNRPLRVRSISGTTRQSFPVFAILILEPKDWSFIISTQAMELNPEDQRAIGIVAQMDQLFELDRKAREQGLSQEDRHALRLEKAPPLLEEIKSQIEAARLGALPKSVLAKACNYTLTLWARLNRFLEYPELELSNNCAENAIRPVALGRN
jgi:transposase